MASRKKKTESLSLGLSLPSPVEASFPLTAPTSTADLGREIPSLPVRDPFKLPDPIMAPPVVSPADLESFDDYDDTALHDDVPRIRLVDPPKSVGVIVEATASGFETSKLTHQGTCWARVSWTREELVELIARAQAALEM